MSTNNYPKGSIGNPYSNEEFEALVEGGAWKGGFVFINETTCVFYKKIDSSSQGEGSGSGSGSDSGSGSGSEQGSNAGSGSDTGSGSDSLLPSVPNVGEGSFLYPHTGSDFGSLLENGNDCFYKCLEYVDNTRFHLGLTSEQYRLDYFCGCYTSSWPGTLREQEYLNGPLPMETVTKPNDDVINYIRSNFIAEDGIVQNINSIRNYFPNDGQCSDGIVIGIYKTNNDPNYVRSHAVIIKSNNRGNLYIYDPQTGAQNLQSEFNGLFDDSKFLYGIKITGLAE